jgi:hypothetical protein
MKHENQPPADAPPPPSHRALLAVGAVVAASLLNAALLALFHHPVPTSMRLATPAIERALDACGAHPGREDRHRCRLGVARGVGPAPAALRDAMAAVDAEAGDGRDAVAR